MSCVIYATMSPTSPHVRLLMDLCKNHNVHSYNGRVGILEGHDAPKKLEPDRECVVSSVRYEDPGLGQSPKIYFSVELGQVFK